MTDVGLLHRRARSVALMHGAGAALCAISVLTPGAVPAGLPRLAYVGIVLTCVSTAVAALVRRARFGVLAVAVALLTGDLAIAAAALVANQRPGGSSTLLLLLWPTLLAAIFLSRRLVALQLVGVALVGGLVFHRAEAGVGVAVIQVLVMTVSLAVAARVVVQLRERLTAAVRQADTLSRTDPLTGLANRRGLDEQLPTLWTAAARRHETLAVLLLDVDHFKAINDQHGHAEGDRVLVALGGVVRGVVRNEDIVARFGGEEIVVVAAETDVPDPAGAAESAADIGERLRRAVEAAALPVPITVSVGSVHHVPTGGEDPRPTFTRLLGLADRAMYEAKAAGRNRVVSVAAAPVAAAATPTRTL